MKLRNKETGEIHEITQAVSLSDDMIKKFAIYSQSEGHNYAYRTLAELNSEWEDAPEEPKEYWFVDYDGGIIPFSRMKETATDRMMKEIGNYFETKEEAEQAVEKLKAWKRLKDKGFKFIGKTYETDKRFGSIFYKVDEDTYSEDIINDLDLLFGGEE